MYTRWLAWYNGLRTPPTHRDALDPNPYLPGGIQTLANAIWYLETYHGAQIEEVAYDTFLVRIPDHADLIEWDHSALMECAREEYIRMRRAALTESHP